MNHEPDEQLLVQASALLERQELVTAADLYRRVGFGSSVYPAALVGLGRVASARGDRVAAVTHFRSSLRIARDPELLATIGGLLRDAGEIDDADAAFREALRTAPAHLRSLVGLAELSRACGDTEAAITYYERAAIASPNDLGIHEALRNLLIEKERFDWRDDISKALAILRRPQTEPRDRFAACVLLVQYGVSEGMQKEFESLRSEIPQAHQWLRTVRQLERSGLARPLPRTGDPRRAEEDELVLSFGVTEKPSPGSDSLILVFGGANHRLGLAFDIVHRILRPTNVHALYLRDLERTCYLGGIVGLGANFGEAAEGLRRTAQRLGAKRILAIGNCVGCVGALRYGIAVQAEAMLCLSPRVREPAALAASRKFTDRATASSSDPLTTTDARELYARTHPRPALHFIYGAHCVDDSTEAQHMVGLEGVTDVPIAGFAGHASLSLLFARGLLTPLLREFVEHGSIGAELRAAIYRAADD